MKHFKEAIAFSLVNSLLEMFIDINVKLNKIKFLNVVVKNP